MRIIIIILLSSILSSCSTTDGVKYSFLPTNQEDNINWEYNKYNLMDSSDGSKDPNAKIKIWRATY